MDQFKVTAQRLNVRREPNTSAIILRTLNLHDLVSVNATDNGWAHIGDGWVSMKHLAQASPALGLADVALSVARSQIGVSEQPQGSNWGPKVQQYLASVGIGFPAAWCMAFVYWCVDKAAREMKTANPLLKTGSVMAQWNASKALRVSMPRTGDLFVMDFGKGLGHIGFVNSVKGDRIQTVEGNSNDEGSREGYEVCRKPGGRPIASMRGFLRLP